MAFAIVIKYYNGSVMAYFFLKCRVFDIEEGRKWFV